MKDVEWSNSALRRIYNHNSTEFPFELAHENGKAHNMREFHWHDFLEITYVVSGQGTYYIENKVIPVAAGDFLIINNIERHRVEFDKSDPLYETVFHFDAQILESILQNNYNLFDYNGTLFYNKLTLDDETRQRLIAIMDEIVLEYNEKKPCYELCVTSQLAHFIAIALRCGQVYLLTAPEHIRNNANIARLENILKYLSAHMEAGTTLKSVAERFFLNSTYFSEYFKKMMGVTFTEYMRELRVSYAVQLMEQDGVKIVEVAYACGFASVSAFYEAFSKVHNMPPQKYMTQRKRNLSR